MVVGGAGGGGVPEQYINQECATHFFSRVVLFVDGRQQAKETELNWGL